MKIIKENVYLRTNTKNIEIKKKRTLINLKIVYLD